MKPRNVIIDCDTGIDDALALLLALRSPEFNVLGITCVCGNVPLDKVVRNTLVVVEHSGKSVPVYRGAYRALVGAGHTAEYVHGSNGLGDLVFPEPKIKENPEHAVDFLIRSFMEATEPIELITLAPLTNIALAIQKEPRLAAKIPSVVMMAGGIENGNSTVAAEFNVYADPEAAEIVFGSGIQRKMMVALDPNRQGGGVYSEDVSQIEASSAAWCQMGAALLRYQLERWKTFVGKEMPTFPPDMTAMGIAIDPSLANAEMLHVDIETGGVHTRGMTVVDRRAMRGIFRAAPEPNINVVWTLDNARYRKLVLDTYLG